MLDRHCLILRACAVNIPRHNTPLRHGRLGLARLCEEFERCHIGHVWRFVWQRRRRRGCDCWVDWSCEEVSGKISELFKRFQQVACSVCMSVKAHRAKCMHSVLQCAGNLHCMDNRSLFLKAQGIRPAAEILHQWDPGYKREVCCQAAETGLWHLCIWGLLSCTCSCSCHQGERLTASPAGIWW